ncbi:calcium dependent phosphoinositide phospholipase C [Aureococcus anophagefferens]|nr:calcium dependent phosphoinositide phospholipase C [Aureococcus anophagefferens]
MDVHVDSATRKALVYHVQSLDFAGAVLLPRDCLGSLVDWSRRRSGDHGLVVVLLEVKGTKSYVEDVASHFRGLGDDRYPESRDALRVIDDTIFDAFAPTPHSLLTPDDVAGDYASPGASVRDGAGRRGSAARSPSLLDSSQEAQLTRAYDASRRPRAMFTMGSAVVGAAAAIYKYDNPNNPDHFAAIQAAVRWASSCARGRTRSVRGELRALRQGARAAPARELRADAKSNWLASSGTRRAEARLRRATLADRPPRDDAEPAAHVKLRFWHEVLPAISVAAVPAVPLLPMSAKLREQMSATAPSNEVRALLRFAFSAAAEGLGITLVGGQSIGDGYVYARADGAAEFRQEAKIHDLARAVAARRGVGLICIAGPTSSGKTAFAAKLGMYLRNEGVDTVGLTVDHYYLPLDRQPKYQKRKQRSDVDYDAVESMGGPLVGDHINAAPRRSSSRPSTT